MKSNVAVSYGEHGTTIRMTIVGYHSSVLLTGASSSSSSSSASLNSCKILLKFQQRFNRDLMRVTLIIGHTSHQVLRSVDPSTIALCRSLSCLFIIPDKVTLSVRPYSLRLVFSFDCGCHTHHIVRSYVMSVNLNGSKIIDRSIGLGSTVQGGTSFF